MAVSSDYFLKGDDDTLNGNANLSHSITDWSVSLVREPDSSGVPSAPEALGGVGQTSWCDRYPLIRNGRRFVSPVSQPESSSKLTTMFRNFEHQ